MIGLSKTARLPTGNITVVIGSARAYVDGKTLALDAPAVEIDGTAYVPLRLLTAALGAQVSYDQRGAKVEIVSLYVVGRNSGAESARVGRARSVSLPDQVFSGFRPLSRQNSR